MGIKLDKNREKSITMELDVEGIEKDKLNFTFRIEGENCELGFPGKLVEENKLRIEIPALKSAGYIKKGTYTASLEVDDNDRYFMKPWEGEVEVESSPEVTAVHEEELGKTTQNRSIKVENISESSKEPEKPTKKWTKEDAKKFINEARKRLGHKDPEKVDQYIAQELEKRGFNYTPKKKKKQSKQKNVSESKPTKTFEKASSKQDVIEYLNSRGMKKESSVNYILEKLENDTGGDVEKMLDLAKDMLEGGKTQNPLQESQAQITKYYESMNPDESDKESLMSRIQEAKANLHSQFGSQ